MKHPNCIACGKEIAGVAYASMKKKGFLDEHCNDREEKTNRK